MSFIVDSTDIFAIVLRSKQMGGRVEVADERTIGDCPERVAKELTLFILSKESIGKSDRDVYSEERILGLFGKVLGIIRSRKPDRFDVQ